MGKESCCDKPPSAYRFMNFQSKLNCEILDDKKGYEVRWAIAGKSMVTQLVARYSTYSLFLIIFTYANF